MQSYLPDWSSKPTEKDQRNKQKSTPNNHQTDRFAEGFKQTKDSLNKFSERLKEKPLSKQLKKNLNSKWASKLFNPNEIGLNNSDNRAKNEMHSSQDSHLDLAKESLSKLLSDKNIPKSIRRNLNGDFKQLEQMLDKLEQGQIHIAVFGRVSVGKSSLLNALLNKEQFGVSLLHGETKKASMSAWEEYKDGNLFLIDTPGINEIDGEERERMAHEVANRVDLLLFVVDSDLTDVELQALKVVAEMQRPILLIVNKSDQYNETELLELRAILRERTKAILAPENIVFAAAQPIKQVVIYIDEDGNEEETVRQRPVDIINVKSRLWDILEAEGQTLSALNASLFAGSLSEDVSQRILAVRKEIGQKTIHHYCLFKGVAVGFNPIPVLDLFAAAAIDIAMVSHLSKVYGLPMSKNETGELVRTILAHLILLMGTTWAVNLIASTLKLGTGGFSTLLTGVTQGAISWYSTLVVGKVAEAWLLNGKSWGDAGPKMVVQEILNSLDRNSVLNEAKEEMRHYLRRSPFKNKDDSATT
jgi:small GTP-binding protein